MFQAAILIARQYNISIQGQVIAGQIVDTAGTEINAIAAACKAISTSNIVGIVGPGYSSEAPIIAGIGARIGIPVISQSATDPTLSNRNAYPAFYRTVPSDNAAALAIAQLFLTYNWTSCLIIYQNDAFGNGGATAITNAFLKNGLGIAGTIVFDIVTLRLQDNLNDVLTASPTRIVVLWVNPPYVPSIIQNALDYDLIGSNYLWITSASFDLSNFNQTYYPNLIGLLNLEPTVTSVANAPINATLLNTAFDLWNQYEPETFPGSNNVDDYALFAFDAAWTLVQSLQKFCSITSNTSSCISLSNATYCFDRYLFNSNTLFDIINNMEFLGVSGHIQFSANTTDRINGSYYVANNIQYSSTGINFVQALSYSDSTGWQRNTLTQLIWPENTLAPPTSGAKLEGVKLILGLMQSTQYTNIINVADAFGNTTFQLVGYIPDLINLLKTKLGFIPDIRLAPSNQTYNGLVHDVANGIYDLVVVDLTVTANRREKVDFSNSIFDNSVRLVIRAQPDIQIDLFSFLKPFSWDLWLLIIGTLIFGSILICIVERGANERLRKKSHSAAYLMFIWYTFGNFMGRDVKLHPKTIAGRLISSAMFFLTLNGEVPGNRIGLLVGSASLEYYLTELSGGNPNYYPLYSRDQIYQSLLDDKIDVGFIDTGSAEYMTNDVYCNLTIAGSGFDVGIFAIPMRKGWIYANDLDVALLLLRESGDLNNLYAKWFQYKNCPDNSVLTDAIDSRALIGLFMVFGIVCVLSIFIFAWGKLHMTKKLTGRIYRIIDSLNKKCHSAREDATRSSHDSEIRELETVKIGNF
ncbi:unnamed protein product [Rotaria magnacalcarata]|uniref:Ionotropic glutamate receptor C-terminal domain-containing protein n=2 Tax=Rotaria magnacalcarata TaxID=392030 RepID=A0A815B4J4_9BILA|nr:unnamed protein product [Rotaria magnacalcarata]